MADHEEPSLIDNLLRRRRRKRFFEPDSDTGIPLTTLKRHMKNKQQVQTDTFQSGIGNCTSSLPLDLTSSVPGTLCGSIPGPSINDGLNLNHQNAQQQVQTDTFQSGIGNCTSSLPLDLTSSVPGTLCGSIPGPSINDGLNLNHQNAQDCNLFIEVNAEGDEIVNEANEHAHNGNDHDGNEVDENDDAKNADENVNEANEHAHNDNDHDGNEVDENDGAGNADENENDDGGPADGNENEDERNADENNNVPRQVRFNFEDDPAFFDNIVENVVVFKADLLYMALGLAVQNKDSNKAFNDEVRLLNNVFQTNVLPNSKYLLDKLVKSDRGVKYFFYCGTCSEFFGEIANFKNMKQKICDQCGADNPISDLTLASFFVLFDIVSQIEVLLSEHRQVLLTPTEAVALAGQEEVSDIYDGTVYRDFAERTSAMIEKIISMSCNVDGTPLFKSSLGSIWPISGYIHELPPSVRMKNLILFGLWFGNKQPMMDLFLGPFVDEMLHLSQGFNITVNNDKWEMRAFVLGFCVDSGARGKVQGLKTHGGYCACNWCRIRGIYLAGAVRYSLTEEIPPVRTHEEIVRMQLELVHPVEQNLEDEEDNAENEEDNAENEDEGVIKISPLINLPLFDMVEGFYVDGMHLLHLGVAKGFLSKWLNEDGTDYYIKPFEDIIDSRIKALTPPLEFRRMPRTLDELPRYKAREWENFLLFWCYIVLTGILPDRYLQLWLVLAQAVSMFKQTTVIRHKIDVADALTKYFMVKSQEFYGEEAMTFNMHLLYHLAEHVARWGPLWAATGYTFESFNAFLKSIIHSQEGIPHQVIRAYSWVQAMRNLKPRVSAKAIQYVKSLQKQKPRGVPGGVSYLHSTSSSFIPTDEERFLCENEGCNVNTAEEYGKIITNDCTFTKSGFSNSTDNSVALLNNGQIVLIHKIIYDRDNDNVFLIVSNVHTEPVLNVPQGIHIELEDHLLRKITLIEEEKNCVSDRDLKIVCFKATTNNHSFVAPLPNIMNVF